jgi:hypothetical protein
LFMLARASVICGALAALCVTSSPARARVFIGVGVPLFFPPVVVGPPAYYAPYYYGPPVVYAPPTNNFSYTPPSAGPQSLAPPATYTPGGGYTPSGAYTPGDYTPYGASDVSAQACHAGAYVCPLVRDTPPGGVCACPVHGGQLMRGQAD